MANYTDATNIPASWMGSETKAAAPAIDSVVTGFSAGTITTPMINNSTDTTGIPSVHIAPGVTLTINSDLVLIPSLVVEGPSALIITGGQTVIDSVTGAEYLHTEVHNDSSLVISNTDLTGQTTYFQE